LQVCPLTAALGCTTRARATVEFVHHCYTENFHHKTIGIRFL
jgi:hypothetical protein